MLYVDKLLTQTVYPLGLSLVFVCWRCCRARYSVGRRGAGWRLVAGCGLADQFAAW